MNLTTCLKKMELVGVLAFATVDHNGAPQIRNISAIHYEPDALYFFTARGKNFCRELEEDGRVQILCYTKYKEMIRLSGRARAVEASRQIYWRDKIFEEQPYLANVYPGDTRDIGIVFCIDQGDVEYFNLGVNPIFREIYPLGKCYNTGKGICNHRPLHRLRNLSGEMSAEMYYCGGSLSDSAGTLPSLRQLPGKLSRKRDRKAGLSNESARTTPLSDRRTVKRTKRRGKRKRKRKQNLQEQTWLHQEQR